MEPEEVGWPQDCREQGMVTVELALGLGALFTVLALVLAAVAGIGAKNALCDQVRQEARAYSVGGTSPNVEGVELTVSDSGTDFTVRGTRPAVEIAGWSAGTLECSINGTLEWAIPWASLAGEP